MKIESIKIANLRVFLNETINLNNYTCLVGPNGAGKSTVLTALNIFFRETAASQLDLLNLSEEDFHCRDTSKPIEITLTFGDLSEDAQKDFQSYYRHDKLTISAIASWDKSTNVAIVKHYGQRMVIADFKPFFKAFGDGALVAELKNHYTNCVKLHQSLPQASTKVAMVQELQKFESSHSELCEMVTSEDQFYGATKGTNYLRKYIQWVYVPAVKDASTEQTELKKTALGALLERTVRSKVAFAEPIETLRLELQEKYGQLLRANQDKLDSISISLNAKLQDWAHQASSLRLEWQSDPATGVRIAEPLAQIIAGEGGFEGKLARLGHGLQRCFLLALLQELAGIDENQAPTLVLGCEEPELYQHPPQARHLAIVLQRLSQNNSQVIISTHSTYFVSGQGFEDVRAVRKHPKTGIARVYSLTYSDLADAIASATSQKPITRGSILVKIQQALQPNLNEMLFSPILILIEGLEDLAYITSYMMLMDKWDDFRRLGCHMVPTNGKSSMIQPLAIANILEIPKFVIFDSDGHSTDKNGSRIKHEKDNRAILSLCSAPDVNPFPKDSYWGDDLVMWHSELGAIVTEDYGKDAWVTMKAKVMDEEGIQISDLQKKWNVY